MNTDALTFFSPTSTQYEETGFPSGAIHKRRSLGRRLAAFHTSGTPRVQGAHLDTLDSICYQEHDCRQSGGDGRG